MKSDGTAARCLPRAARGRPSRRGQEWEGPNPFRFGPEWVNEERTAPKRMPSLPPSELGAAYGAEGVQDFLDGRCGGAEEVFCDFFGGEGAFGGQDGFHRDLPCFKLLTCRSIEGLGWRLTSGWVE